MALSPWVVSSEISIIIAAALLSKVNPEEAAMNPQARTSDFHAWWLILRKAEESGEITVRWERLSAADDQTLWQLVPQDKYDPWTLKWAIKNRGFIDKSTLHAWLRRQGYKEKKVPKEIRYYPRATGEGDASWGEGEHDLPEGADHASEPEGQERESLPDHIAQHYEMVTATYQKFWANYNPECPRPQQTAIVDWIMTEYGLSKTKATAAEKLICPVERKR